ncbi:MAG: hypothetical protein ACSHX9_17405 [Luteolibacter sp.]
MPPIHGVELADLAGNWTLAEFHAPTRLRENFYNTVTMTNRLGTDSHDFPGEDEILEEAFYFDPLTTGTRNFSLSAAGAVTGGETGQVLSLSANRILYSDGTELTTVYSSITAEVLIASGREIESQEQNLCLKRPTTFNDADLGGTWAIIAMTNPRDLSKTSAGGRLTDVFFTGSAEFVSGEIVMDGVGGFTGVFDGTISGTANGDITVTTAEGSIPFKINASKNFLTATQGDTDEQDYIILTKNPSTLTTAELAGTWRITALQLPTTLTEFFFNTVTETTRQADSSGSAMTNEILIDLSHTDKSELTRLQLMADSAGNITGSETGTLVANGDKSVSVTLDGELFTMHPNADKTVMIGAQNFGDSHELVIAIKTSETVANTFDEMADFKTIPTSGNLILTWNSASNLMLQDSVTLSGWDEVEEAADTDAFEADTTGGGARFFRISERIDPP